MRQGRELPGNFLLQVDIFHLVGCLAEPTYTSSCRSGWRLARGLFVHISLAESSRAGRDQRVITILRLYEFAVLERKRGWSPFEQDQLLCRTGRQSAKTDRV